MKKFLMLLLVVARLQAAELGFEVVDPIKSHLSRERQTEIFLDAYDAFSSVIRDGSYEWVNADGHHRVSLENARLFTDPKAKTIHVVVPLARDAATASKITDALFWAYFQKHRQRMEEALVRYRAKLDALQKARDAEKDTVRHQILEELVAANAPRLDGKPEETRLRIIQAIKPQSP